MSYLYSICAPDVANRGVAFHVGLQSLPTFSFLNVHVDIVIQFHMLLVFLVQVESIHIAFILQLKKNIQHHKIT